MVVIVTMTAVGSAFRLEWRPRLHELRSEAKKHMLDHMVWPNAENLVSDFSRQMSISQMPGETQKPIGVLMPDFDDTLGGGLNLQQPPIVELQAVSIGHG